MVQQSSDRKVSVRPRGTVDLPARIQYHGKLRIGTGFAFLSGITSIESVFPQVKLPLLLVHGVRASFSRTRAQLIQEQTKDRVTDPKKTQELYATAASQDKSLRLVCSCSRVVPSISSDIWHRWKAMSMLCFVSGPMIKMTSLDKLF